MLHYPLFLVTFADTNQQPKQMTKEGKHLLGCLHTDLGKELDLVEIVVVSARAVNYLAEKPHLYHVEHHHLAPAVTAVFEHHNRHTGLFVGPYKLVALLEIFGASYLYWGGSVCAGGMGHSLDESGEYPILILDDVMSELDAGRRQYLLSALSGRLILVTACDERDFSRTDAHLIKVSGGKYEAVSE